MSDTALKTSASRHSVEQRIGVLEELLSERYSCRAFRPDPVPRLTIERILTAAQKTASWCNSQPAKQALENFNFFGAPHVAIVHTDEALGVYGAIDCGGYVTSFMLAAQALGIATVPQAALAFHSELVRRHFGLGDDRKVVCGISFGFPDRDHKANSYRTTRAGIADTVKFVDE